MHSDVLNSATIELREDVLLAEVRQDRGVVLPRPIFCSWIVCLLPVGQDGLRVGEWTARMRLTERWRRHSLA